MTDPDFYRYPRTLYELSARIAQRERNAANADAIEPQPPQGWRTILMHCTSGACEGGKYPCPTPQACIVASERSERAARRGMACVVVVIAACVAIAAASVFMLHATGGAL